MIILETPRVFLRTLTLEDVDGLLEIFSDPVAMQYYPSVKTRQETLQWIQRNIESYQMHGHGLWAMIDKTRQTFLGECGITIQQIDGEPIEEIGYHVQRKYWGQGYATEAATACRNYLFDVLQKDRVVSWMRPENIPSRRVAEKNGMTLTKTTHDRRGYPAVVYSITRAQYLSMTQGTS